MTAWWKGLISSFRYACEGVGFALRTQRNMRIHFLSGFSLIVLMLILPFTFVQLAMLFACMALVICMELMNTAVEQMIDLVQPSPHPLAKAAKDTAAAAVLVAAVFAVCTGGLIVIPVWLELHTEAETVWKWMVTSVPGILFLVGNGYVMMHQLAWFQAKYEPKQEDSN
ncbi:diacylglycerol kinase family protein [Marinicrinis sediminis]|uniref:Diacylglycerol kinase family protein n=1 Tax=Marinicrinis sediminis TaxID=1652465 RepID=A0ABW5RDA4_9BACL